MVGSRETHFFCGMYTIRFGLYTVEFSGDRVENFTPPEEETRVSVGREENVESESYPYCYNLMCY